VFPMVESDRSFRCVVQGGDESSKPKEISLLDLICLLLLFVLRLNRVESLGLRNVIVFLSLGE